MKTTDILHFIVITSFVIVFFSCRQTQDNLPCIDVRKNYPEKEILLTDIADVTYLHINSDNADYLYSGTIHAVTANTIVIADSYFRSSGDILFFDRDGHPMSRFNHKGNGPGEYRDSYRVFYDEEADDVFVYSLSSNSIIQVYSSTGKYKREIPLPQGAMIQEIVSLDEHSFFFYDASMEVKRSMTNESDLSAKDYVEPFYRISKTDGTVLDYLELPIAPIFLGIYQDGMRIPGRKTRLISNKEGVLLCNPENDTVFLYGKDQSLTPILHKTPLASATTPVTFLNNCIDAGNYQFTEVHTARPGDVYAGIFPVKYYIRNKRTGEIFQQKLLLPDYQGKEFVISSLYGLRAYESGYFFELDLIELKQACKENKLSGKLKELVTTLKEDDNNVFVMVNFK